MMAAIMKEEHGQRFYATDDGFVISQACIAFRVFTFGTDAEGQMHPEVASARETMGCISVGAYIESIGGERFGEYDISYRRNIPAIDLETGEQVGTYDEMTVESGYWPSID